MRLFISDVSQLRGRGLSGSELVRALLRYAVRESWGIECPPIDKAENGKPFFRDCEGKYLSLSHSKGHILVALSEHDVGGDIETLREIKGRAERLFSCEMLSDFGYYGAWTLRESVFKLSGQGSLRSMEIKRCGENIIAQEGNVRCRIYEDIPGCVASLACREGEFPDKAEIVELSAFWA